MIDRWLIRASQWSRRPPSWKKVRMLLLVVALCAAVLGFEHVWRWPDWLTVNSRAKMP